MKFKLSQAEARKKWVEALRSGEYAQGEKCLFSNGRYCCLGVACEVFRKEEFDDREPIEGGTLCSYPNVQKWLGLYGPNGRYGNYLESSLIKLNDWEKKSFSEIADLIESSPPGLFVEPSLDASPA